MLNCGGFTRFVENDQIGREHDAALSLSNLCGKERTLGIQHIQERGEAFAVAHTNQLGNSFFDATDFATKVRRSFSCVYATSAFSTFLSTFSTVFWYVRNACYCSASAILISERMRPKSRRGNIDPAPSDHVLLLPVNKFDVCLEPSPDRLVSDILGYISESATP